MRNGLVLVGLVSTALLLALFAFSQFYLMARVDARSYLFGMLYMLTLCAITTLVPRIYRYFLVRGWTASLADWRERSLLQFDNDWGDIDSYGWDVEFLRAHVNRSKTKGTLSICVAVLGFHVHVGVLVDKEERDRHIQAMAALREQQLAQMPPMIRDFARQMMDDVPLDTKAEFKAGVIPIPTPVPGPGMVDDDDDDDEGNGGNGVH